jgi:hypothetical protein
MIPTFQLVRRLRSARYFTWVKRLRNNRRLVIGDADRLIARFGADACEEASARIHADREQRVIDIDRPSGHWDKVRLEIQDGRPDSGDARGGTACCFACNTIVSTPATWRAVRSTTR